MENMALCCVQLSLHLQIQQRHLWMEGGWDAVFTNPPLLLQLLVPPLLFQGSPKTLEQIGGVTKKTGINKIQLPPSTGRCLCWILEPFTNARAQITATPCAMESTNLAGKIWKQILDNCLRSTIQQKPNVLRAVHKELISRRYKKFCLHTCKSPFQDERLTCVNGDIIIINKTNIYANYWMISFPNTGSK